MNDAPVTEKDCLECGKDLIMIAILDFDDDTGSTIYSCPCGAKYKYVRDDKVTPPKETFERTE
jgi:hypothetical protein